MATLNIQELGASAIQQYIARGNDTILIPVGSCERHGNPFTPLGLDGSVTYEVTGRAARKAETLHTPLMPYGYTPHHMGRESEGCGTITLKAETYRRVLEDIARSLIYHGFNKLIFVSFHSYNQRCAEEVLFAIRQKTGVLAAFYGGRESDKAREILRSPPEMLASDFESAIGMAILGDNFNHQEFSRHGYRIHAPEWLGPSFAKAAGTGMAVRFQGQDNIVIGMNDMEYVDPISLDHHPESNATREKGDRILDDLAAHLADFTGEIKQVKVSVHNRNFDDRAR